MKFIAWTLRYAWMLQILNECFSLRSFLISILLSAFLIEIWMQIGHRITRNHRVNTMRELINTRTFNSELHSKKHFYSLKVEAIIWNKTIGL